MLKKCETCKNLDPFDISYGGKWISGPVFEDPSIKLPNIIDNGRRGSCSYCSLLVSVVNDFVPDWKSRVDQVSLHVTAPVNRPIEIRIYEALAPDEQLDEL